MSLYSVVVPVYNSEHTLQELYTRLEKSIPAPKTLTNRG